MFRSRVFVCLCVCVCVCVCVQAHVVLTSLTNGMRSVHSSSQRFTNSFAEAFVKMQKSCFVHECARFWRLPRLYFYKTAWDGWVGVCFCVRACVFVCVACLCVCVCVQPHILLSAIFYAPSICCSVITPVSSHPIPLYIYTDIIALR